MRSSLRALAGALAILMIAPVANASPVAQTKAERELYGRTFLEPLTSYDFIQFGDKGEGEFAGGMKLLEKLYPRYLDFTTLQEETGDKDAVSVGADTFPPWHARDTGDGLPLHAAILTDTRVPDREKEYVALMASHQAEPCGREAMWRFLEDLLIDADTNSETLYDNATGQSDKTVEMTASELLKRTKIYFVSPSPDGWRSGDTPNIDGFSQYNGAGINSNRVAYQDGWSFPPDPVLYQQGYTTLTQPEGAAPTEWLKGIRDKELGGKPFAVGMDVHGPVPAGFILLHDQGNDPQKLEQMVDLGLRIRRNMEETLPPASALDESADFLAEELRRVLPDVDGSTADQTAWRSSGLGRWAFVTHIADSLSYTAANTWGGWMNSDSGLDAVSLSYEINCRAGGVWDPLDHQLWVDNMRAVFETGVVTAAAKAAGKLGDFRYKVAGDIGFYESGARITDRDGNPVPPPPNFPNHPLLRQIEQGHYDVSNTDYMRDLAGLIGSKPEEISENELDDIDRLDTFVVADTQVKNVKALDAFAKSGGNLVLTDSALKLLPSLSKISGKAIARRWGYVGYSDLKRTHPLTHGLLVTARQTYDPTGLGYPLLMERDGYWSSDGSQSGSNTKNNAPIWVVDRTAWEEAGGETIGTVDPPTDRKQTSEGSGEPFTNIGFLPSGKGRIVIFGALLPQPTEDFSHWFGLNAYTVSAAGQTMFIRAIDWKRK